MPSESGAAPQRSSRDEALLRLVDPGEGTALLLTRSRRLARTLRLRVAELRAAEGRKVCDTPPIHALEDWLELTGRAVLAREAAAAAPPPSSAKPGAKPSAPRGRVLLSSAAEQLLWEKVIVESSGDEARQLLDTASLAVTAAEAWKRVCLWGEPDWNEPLVLDAESFREWLPRFRARLVAGGFATSAELSALVAGAIARGDLDDLLPRELAPLGFEKADRELERIVEAMTKRGRTRVVETLAVDAAPATATAGSAADPAAELRSVASRIRERLLADPALRIGVLAPDLSIYGSRLERIFEEELDPAGVLEGGGSSARRFDLAESPTLADYPLVANALDLLSVTGRRLPFETASRILLSVHPRESAPAEAARREGAPAEAARSRVRRGVVEARLRRERSAVLHLRGNRTSLATVMRSEGLGEAAARFEQLGAHLDEQRELRRSPSAWRREWIARLDILGWPGDIDPDREGLVFRRWRDALDELAMLESVEPLLGEEQALARLRAICASTPVQPASSGLSVQVMKLLDAAGLDFDVVFVLGMTATAFPPPPRPNPLLPVGWQRRQQGMPRVSVEGERALAQAVWERVLRSAPEVHASWPAVGDGDEEQSPSHFVAKLAATPLEAPQPWWLEAARRVVLEARPDDAPGPARVRRGSPSIIAQQSDCSFRAFAAQRLAGEALDAIQPQPNPSRRGTLVHKALETAYTDIPSRSDLAGLSDANIDEVAARAADVAVEKQGDFFADAADLANATRLWLREIVAAWMRYERDERLTDWRIEKLEADETASFPRGVDEPLTIRFRPDRIDRVEDDGIVIVDWKTSTSGKTSSRWNGERPAEPQLPLYLALLAEAGHRVDGIAFANLSARDDCSLVGSAARELSDKLRPPGNARTRSAAGYDALVAAWRASVEALALAYLEGRVHPDPREPRICEQCGGLAFCRKREAGVANGDDEEEEDGE